MSINAIGPSFQGNAVTKNGATYDKTKTGKGIGTGVGAAIGTGIMLKSSGAYKAVFTKGSSKVLMAANIVLWALSGLGLGAVVDKVTNNKRANKADVEQGKVLLG